MRMWCEHSQSLYKSSTHMRGIDCEQVVLKGFVLGTGIGGAAILLQPRSTDLDLGTLALPPHL